MSAFPPKTTTPAWSLGSMCLRAPRTQSASAFTWSPLMLSEASTRNTVERLSARCTRRGEATARMSRLRTMSRSVTLKMARSLGMWTPLFQAMNSTSGMASASRNASGVRKCSASTSGPPVVPVPLERQQTDSGQQHPGPELVLGGRPLDGIVLIEHRAANVQAGMRGDVGFGGVGQVDGEHLLLHHLALGLLRDLVEAGRVGVVVTERLAVGLEGADRK